MVWFIFMLLLIILSLEVNSGRELSNHRQRTLIYKSGEAVKSAGAHDKGSWIAAETRLT